MKTEVRDGGPLEKELEIHLDAAEVGSFIDEIIGTYRRRYTLPGFRPGKAPDEVIQRRFSDEIERATLSELVPRSIDRAFAEHRIHPAAPGEVSQIRYRPGEPLTFRVRVEVWPEIELASYEGMVVEQPTVEITGEQVDAFLAELGQRAAELIPVERAAQAGDLVEARLETIDVEGRRIKGTKPEPARLEVGAPNLLPEFREAIDGLQAGETREFVVQYPETHGEASLRGAQRHYRLRAERIQEKKVPPLDDAFAQRFDPQLDLEGLRARVRLRLESEQRLAGRERLEATLVDRLIEANPFDLPPGAVRHALDRLAEHLAGEAASPPAGPAPGAPAPPSGEEIERQYRPRIERMLRRDYLLEQVGRREGVEVTEAQVDEEITRMAREEKRTVEEVRKDLGDPGRFRQFLFDRRVFEALTGKVMIRQVPAPSAESELAGAAAPAEQPEAKE